MMRLIRGGRIIDPSQNIDEKMDLLIREGKILKAGRNLDETLANFPDTTPVDLDILDVTGCIVVPGLIDMHTHLRDPGFEYKETIQSGTTAAAAGGFTAVACMPNTNPVNDSRSVTEYIVKRAAECGLARVYPIAAISRALEGRYLSEFQDLKDAGAVAFSDDGKPVLNSALMRRSLEYAFSIGLPVISHCEDVQLSAGGVMNEGLASTELGLAGIPSLAEEVMVARDILIAGYTGTSVHIAHVSTAGSVALIRNAKQRGIPVTAETAPHYFSMTDDAVRDYDTNTKVNPPLRTAMDVESIKEGLRDGTIDAIASDHAPHAVTEKELEYDLASFGISGLETSLSLSLKLVFEGILTLPQLIAKMSTLPARILSVHGGTLKEGSLADITVIDLEKVWTVDPSTFRSKGRNSPFAGRQLRGKALLTFVGGEIKFRDVSFRSQNIGI
jgi:dihydroorotase